MQIFKPKEIIDLYVRRADTYDKDFDKRWLGPVEVAKRITQFFNKASGGGKSMKMLDLGIGTGLLSAPIKNSFPSCSISGVDLCQAMLDKCAEKKIADDLKCVDVQADGIPYENGSFDIVASSGVFEILDDPAKVLSEMARVLRPGGLLAFSNLKTNFHGSYTDISHPDADLRRALKANGVVLDDVTEFTSYKDTNHKHDIYAGHKKRAYAAKRQVA